MSSSPNNSSNSSNPSSNTADASQPSYCNTSSSSYNPNSERPKPLRSRSVRFDPDVVVIKDSTTATGYPKEGPNGDGSKTSHDGEEIKENKKR